MKKSLNRNPRKKALPLIVVTPKSHDGQGWKEIDAQSITYRRVEREARYVWLYNWDEQTPVILQRSVVRCADYHFNVSGIESQ